MIPFCTKLVHHLYKVASQPADSASLCLLIQGYFSQIISPSSSKAFAVPVSWAYFQPPTVYFGLDIFILFFLKPRDLFHTSAILSQLILTVPSFPYSHFLRALDLWLELEESQLLGGQNYRGEKKRGQGKQSGHGKENDKALR